MRLELGQMGNLKDFVTKVTTQINDLKEPVAQIKQTYTSVKEAFQTPKPSQQIPQSTNNTNYPPKKDNSNLYIALTVGVGVLMTGAIIMVASSKKKAPGMGRVKGRLKKSGTKKRRVTAKKRVTVKRRTRR